MVEGHGCHRVVAQHRRRLLHKVFQCSSPNGRFSADASVISGKKLTRIEAVGKNLFYFFNVGPNDALKIVHIHFGMSGRFSVHAQSKAPTPTPTTRLLMVSAEHDLAAQLSAMTCRLEDESYFEQKVSDLGPDPLREDADVERLWASMQRTKKSVGQVLMDQSLVAGVGNIFRAEILYKARLHPEIPARSLPRAEFDTLWRHTVECLQRGFQTGSIITVDKEDAVRLGEPWTRRYVYNQTLCGECKSRIQSWQDPNKRTIYACTTCQVLREATEVPPERQDALENAKPAQVFHSHCAPDRGAALTVEKMTVAQLRGELASRGIEAPPRKARKRDLVALLEGQTVQVGTAHIGQVATATEAVLEKRRAGENRAVEHTAEQDDESRGLVYATPPPKKRPKEEGTSSEATAMRTGRKQQFYDGRP